MNKKDNCDFCQCNDVNAILDGVGDENGCWDICEKCGKRILGSFIPYATDNEIREANQNM